MDTLLIVDGMTCPRCSHHVTTALKELDGVEEVEVKLRERTVRVKHSADVETPAFVSALQQAGYPSRAA